MKTLGLFCLVAVLWVYGAPAAGAEQKSSESIGQKVDSALERLKQEAQDAAKRLREGFERVRATVDNMGAEARVYARLRWDKALEGAAVHVDVGSGGVATLEGTVPSEAAKAKARQLAGDTVGVERVVDKLTVSPRVPR